MPPSSTQKNTSLGCTILFLMPFVIVGVGALCTGFYRLFTSGKFAEETIAMLAVGSMFSLVGGGMLGAVLYGWRKEKELERLKIRYPDTPWLWREDWAEGRVRSTTPASMLVYWLFGLLFGGFSLPIFLNMDQILGKGPVGYLVLLMPLVSVAMLVTAVYATMRWLKYGQTWCDLVSNPGVVGGWFRAVIWAKVNLTPQDTVETQLTCFHCYVTGSGKNRSSHRKVKWQEKRTLTREHLATEQDGNVAIPIKFYIPRSCTPTTPGSPTDRMEWELKATSEVAGIDFLTEFIVPIFLTEDSSNTPPEDLDEHALSAVDATYSPTILITEGVDFLEFHAPPRRSWSMTLSMTLFTFILTAVVVFLIFSSKAPILFPIVFGLVDILMIGGTVWLWFGHARVRFEHGTARIRKTVFGLGSDTTIELTTVTKVDAHITMQSGTTPYYTIQLHTTAGKKNTVGGIQNKTEAMDLVRRIQALLPNRSGT